MRSIILTLFMLPLLFSMKAQIIDDDYEKTGVIERHSRTHEKLPFFFIANEEKNVVLIGYDFTPTKWEAYTIDTWEKISFFETKGHSLAERSFFSPNDQDIIYIKKNGGKLISEVDYKKGTVVKKKSKDLPRGCSTKREKDYKSYWAEDYRTQVYFYKQYAFEVEDYTITAYKRIK